MAETVSLSHAREVLGDVVNRVSVGGERVVIQRNGKNVAALVSLDDLETLRALEDRADLELMKSAEAEMKLHGPVDWQRVRGQD